MVGLFDPVALGSLHLPNRVVMAPMTRSRAEPGDIPGPLSQLYYEQRASAGMIVTEGVHPSPDGKGYCRTPGLFNEAQAEAWRLVTDRVHARGASIVLQIMHVGRIASAHNKDSGARTVAPSAIRAAGTMYTDAVGMADFDMPEELTTAEIPEVIAQFAHCARLARVAGFDGVELHCTSGYLPMQFLSTSTNQRTDAYGGSVSNRIRFVVETMEALAAEIGADRVGFRIAPGNRFNDIVDEDPATTYAALLDALNPLRPAFLHLVDLRLKKLDARALTAKHWQGPKIFNESIHFAEAQRLIGEGTADAISFGRAFIANPDLVERLREGHALAEIDPATLYTPGPAGYTDYPAFARAG